MTPQSAPPLMGSYRRHVFVCTGGFCSPEHRGRELYQLLAQLLQREGLLFGPGRVKRGETPCLGVCAGGADSGGVSRGRVVPQRHAGAAGANRCGASEGRARGGERRVHGYPAGRRQGVSRPQVGIDYDLGGGPTLSRNQFRLGVTWRSAARPAPTLAGAWRRAS